MCITHTVSLQINKVNRSPQESVAHANDDCLIEISRETAAHITALSASLFFLLLSVSSGMWLGLQ